MLPLVALILASFLWATSGIISKILLPIYQPFPLAFWRFLAASVIITPLFLSTLSREKKFLKFLKHAVFAALFSTGNILLFYLGLVKTTASASIIIYTGSPLIVAILSYFMLRERLSLRKRIGIIIGFIGVVTIVLLPHLGSQSNIMGNTSGNLLVFVASLSWSIYTILSRRLITEKSQSPLTLSFVSIITSTVIFGFLSPATTLAAQLRLFASHPLYLLLIIYLGVLVTAVTYLLYQWVIKQASATTASLTNYLQPVFGVTLSVFVLKERITAGFIAGSLLVITGIFLTSGYSLIKRVRQYYLKAQSQN